MYMFIFCAMYVYELIEILWSSIYHGKWLEWIKILNLESWVMITRWQQYCLSAAMITTASVWKWSLGGFTG